MIGQTVTHYKILECLGSGGMGVVFQAEDLKLHRSVALKFLPPELTRDAEAKERFLHEARAASRLDHPNICTVHEIDETEDGRVFMVMACYEGETLKKKIERGPLPLAEAAAVAFHVGAGLQRAHEAGIVHRDIKPANIMVTSRGEVKILDFGLAKLTGQTALTHTGATMGTAHYMSPEQARGTGVDHRTDIWSLGVVLYEMVTGTVPFKGEYPPAVIYHILNTEPEPVSALRPDTPPELETVIRRATQKDPAARYADATELLAALADIDAGRKPQTPQPLETAPLPAAAGERPGPPLPPRRRLPRALAVPAGILTALLVAALALLLALPGGRSWLTSRLGIGGLPDQKHVAVLTFITTPSDPDTRALANGLADFLILKLGQLNPVPGSLWLVSTYDLLEEPPASAREARLKYGVNLVVRGSLKRTGNQLHLAIELVRTDSEQTASSIAIDDHISNVSSFQNGMLLSVSRMLGIALTEQAQRTLTSGGTALPGAYVAYLRGLGYLRDHREPQCLNQAITLFSQAVAQDPSFAMAHAALSEGFRWKFKVTDDPIWAEKARDSILTAIRLDSRFCPFFHTLGLIQQNTGRLPAAVDAFNQAIHMNPQSFDDFIQLAVTYRQLERLNDAEEAYRRAIQARPDYWVGYSNLGYFYFLHGRYPEAEKMFRQANRAAPGNSIPFSNLAVMYIKMGKTDAAQEALEQSLSIQPSIEGLTNLGTLYFFKGRYAEASGKFEEALKLKAGKENFMVWGNLAESCRQIPGQEGKTQESFQTAIRLLNNELSSNPSDPSLHAWLAVYEAMVGLKEKAAIEIDICWKSAPKDPEILLNLIRSCELIQRRELTLRIFQEYVDRFGPLDSILKDPDLARLRQDAQGQLLIRKAQGYPVLDK